MADPRPGMALMVGAALLLTACGSPTRAVDSPANQTAAAPSRAAGPKVPDIEVHAFNGDTVALTEYAGTPMVLNFWASWCPPCIAEMPDLETVHQLAGSRITFVGVNTQDTPARAAQLVDETGVTYDLVRDPDGELFQAIGAMGMPSTFYVDTDSVIVGHHTGLLTRETLLDDLREHLGVDLDPVLGPSPA